MNKIIFISLFYFLSLGIQAQEQIFRTSDGVQLYVNVKGKGTPCLYIHGGPGSGSYWMEKFSGDILEQEFTMIYIDLRGVGRSSSPEDGNFGMERMIQDFEELREHLGFEKWVIMGHSFSGTITTAYAFEHPNRIEAMMQFNCSLNLEESITTSWIPKACELLKLKETSYYTNDSIPFPEKLNRLFPLLQEKDVMWKLAYSKKENETIMNKTFNEIPDWNSDFSGVGLSHPDYLKNFKPLTSQIEVPVLFFYGEHDWTIGPEHYKDVAFPKILLFKSKVGHMPFMENKPDIKKAIIKFKKKFNIS